MKKISSKWALALSSIALLMTSCLGDGDSSYTGTQEFALVKTGKISKEKEVYASGIGYITSPRIQELQDGDCVFMSYKVTIKSGGGASVDYLTVEDKDVFKYSDQLITSYSAPQADLTTPFVSTLNIPQIYYPTDELYGDRWYFSYIVKKKEGENYKVSFYYDAANQVDNDGVALTKGNKVIDIRLTKTGIAENGADAKNVASSAVVNFSSLRNMFRSDMDTNRRTVAFFFRYYVLDATGANPTLKTVPSGGGFAYPEEK